MSETDRSRDPAARIGAKHWIRGALGLLAYPVMLFGSAGTLAWLEGWAFVVGLYLFTLFLTIMLWRHDPELLESRMGGMFRKGQARWDKVWVSVFVVVFVPWLPVAGLDAVRYSWSRVPLWLEIAGGVMFAASLVALYEVFRANTFLSPVVEIQSERQHELVDTGPYAIVRHPMYAVMVPFVIGASLMLGSWYATGLSIPLIVMLGVRARLEERTLSNELDGYAEYTTRVRYRLIPGIW